MPASAQPAQLTAGNTILLLVALLVFAAVVLGGPLLQLLLLPAPEMGVYGHAQGLSSPHSITVPPALLLAALGLAGAVFAVRYYRRDRRRLTHPVWLATLSLTLLAVHFTGWRIVAANVRTYAGGGGGNPNCVSTLRQLGQALMLYAHDNAGALPPNLEQLARSSNMDAASLICAWDKQGGQGDPRGQTPSSFVYLGDGKRWPLGVDQIIIYEAPGIHASDGSYALFGDGRTDFVPTDVVSKYALPAKRD